MWECIVLGLGVPRLPLHDPDRSCHRPPNSIQIGTPNPNLFTNMFLDGAMAARLYGSMSVSMTLSPLHFYCISAGGGLPFCSRGASSTPLGLQWADLDQNFFGWGVAAWCGRGWVAPGPVPPFASATLGLRFCWCRRTVLLRGGLQLTTWASVRGSWSGLFRVGPWPPRQATSRQIRPPARQTARPRAPPQAAGPKGHRAPGRGGGVGC